MLKKHFFLILAVSFIALGVMAFASLLGNRPSPPAHIPLNDLQMPVVRSYSSGLKKWPAEKVSVWLKHDGLITDGNGRFVRWLDSGPNRLEFSSAAKAANPEYIKSAVGGFPALRFKKNAFIESGPVLGDLLLKSDSFAVYLIFKPMGDLGESEISDLFGWGDCRINRMLSHLQANERLEFQFGDPIYRTYSMTFANPVNQYNFAVFVGNPQSLSIELNGRLISSRKIIHGFSAKGQTSALLVGNSPCENGFDGEIAELLIASGIEAPTEIDAISEYFIKKYSLEF